MNAVQDHQLPAILTNIPSTVLASLVRLVNRVLISIPLEIAQTPHTLMALAVLGVRLGSTVLMERFSPVRQASLVWEEPPDVRLARTAMIVQMQPVLWFVELVHILTERVIVFNVPKGHIAQLMV